MAIRVLILTGLLASAPAAALTLTRRRVAAQLAGAHRARLRGAQAAHAGARRHARAVADRGRRLQLVREGCNWFVNWADFPSAVVADNGDWLTFWLQKTGEGTYAYAVMTRRSTDRRTRDLAGRPGDGEARGRGARP